MKKSMIHPKRVIALQGKRVILGKSGGVLRPLTNKEAAALGADPSASSKALAQQLACERIKIKLSAQTADRDFSPKCKRITAAVGVLMRLPALFANRAAGALMLFALLLGKVWPLFWPELLSTPLQIRVFNWTMPSEPLSVLARAISGAERWHDDNWQACLPHRLAARIPIGAGRIVDRWEDYTRVEIALKHKTVRLPIAYIGQTVLIDPSFPMTLQRSFTEQHPLAIPIWLNGKCPSRDGVILDIDGTALSTFDDTLAQQIAKYTDEISVILEQFVHDVWNKKRWKRVLFEHFRSFCISERDGHFVRQDASAERRVKAAMLAVWQTLLEWITERDFCSEIEANDVLMDVWAVVLPENCPKKLSDETASLRMESGEAFMTFLVDYLEGSAVDDAWDSGRRAVFREVNGDRLLILPREEAVRAMLGWAEARGVDRSFCKEYKESELPAKLQRVWAADLPELLKDGGRDVTWKYGLADSKTKIAALGIRPDVFMRYAEAHGIEVGTALGQRLCPIETAQPPESEKVDEMD